MRVRFWNASTLALFAGFLTAFVCVAPLFGQELQEKARTPNRSSDIVTTLEDSPRGRLTTAANAEPKGRTIELVLSVAGLGAKGCEVEIKPGNAACKFKPKTVKVTPGSKQNVKLDDVEIRGADRNCSVALTIREEGLPAKTIYRGYRVAAEPKAGSVETFACWMSSPSKVAAVAASNSPAGDSKTRR